MKKVGLDVNTMKNVIETLEKGKKDANFMRRIILQQNSRVKNEDFNYNVDHLTKLIFDTFVTSLDALRSYDFDGTGGVLLGKRKLNHDIEDEESSNNQSIVGNRACYKKSKKMINSRKEEVEHLIDDGFAWRKYGQKSINNSIHPRHYYRCTNKQGQNCQATKQIQQISNNPTKYKVIYHQIHSCNNNNNNNIFMSSRSTIDSPEEQSSGIVVSFNGSSQVNPLLFPTSAFFGSITSPSSVKRWVSEDGSGLNHLVCKESEEILSLENYNSTATSDYFEEDYSTFFMSEFPEMFPDSWTS